MAATTYAITVTQPEVGNVTNVTSQVNGWTTDKRIFMAVLHAVILLTNVIFNSINIIGIILIRRNRRRKFSPVHFFILNLAVADLAAGVLHGTHSIVFVATLRWFGGDFTCRIYYYLTGVFYIGASFMVICLAVDRVEAIARPFRFSSQWTAGHVLVVVSWCLAGVLGITWALCREGPHCDMASLCATTMHGIRMWVIYNYAFVFFIPVAAIITCYTALVCILQKRVNIKSFDPTERCSRSEATNLSEQKTHNTFSTAKRKALIMSAVISTTFILCWSFVVVINFLEAFEVPGFDDLGQYPLLYTFLYNLGTLTHAVNPIVYSAFSGDSLFRRAWQHVSRAKSKPSHQPELGLLEIKGTQKTAETAETEVGSLRSNSTTPLRRVS